MADAKESWPPPGTRENGDCDNHNSNAPARLPDHNMEMNSTPAAPRLNPFDDWNYRVEDNDRQAGETGDGSRDKSDSGNHNSDNHKADNPQSNDPEHQRLEPDNDESNNDEIDYEDLWFDPDLFSQVHSHSGHYVSVSVNGEPVERWIIPLGRDDAGCEIRAGNNIIRLRFRCLDDENTSRLFTFWDDIAKLHLRAIKSPEYERTSSAGISGREHTLPKDTGTNNEIHYDTLADNTMPGSWDSQSPTEDCVTEHPTEIPDGMSTTDTESDDDDTLIEGPDEQDAPDVFKHRVFAPIELPPLLRDLDPTQYHAWKELSECILEAFLMLAIRVVCILPRIYICLVTLLILADWLGSGEARQLLGKLTPLLRLKWTLSREGRATEQEYAVTCERLTAEYHEQLEQLRLQREARWMAWMG
ncbi:hypothetical protein B0T20DRAFT_490499 [Sordaria brevicollis]|uniref:Uncharacterized protein n=1 Tax=Sordaria brevicollis TaxID=83679 RepID=A0AAE0U2I3_SORBR|nr:hypothetical protein B0T20DRAFT_490499 [Sordaria brevicollis]